MANPSAPPPPPPPFPGSPDGFGPLDENGAGWEPRQAVSNGLITTLGILCLLFAMGCGCFHLFGLAGFTTDTDWTEQVREAKKKEIQEIEKIEDANEREAKLRAMDSIDVAVIVAVIEKMSLAMRDSSHFETFILRFKVSTGFQVAMLILGVLLLIRARSSRTLGILICIGAIASIILTAMALPPLVADSLGRTEQLIADDPEMSEHTLEKFQIRSASLSADELQALALTTAAMSVVFPFICLLILLFSGGVRRSLEAKAYVESQNY